MIKRLLGIALAILLLLVPGIALAEDLPNNGIPVVAITIDGGDDEFNKMNTSEDHSYECGGTMSLVVPKGYTDSCELASPTSFENLKLDYIKGRGNSTWNPDGGRNPYKLKLKNKKALLGNDVGASKHWVLMASSIDTSSLRNRLVAYMGTQLGFEFVPVGVHVDLVINGSYRGSYYLAEQVRVGESRVNIDELGPEDVAEPSVTGGYLFSMSPKNDEPADNRITTSRNVEFCGENPQFDPAVAGTNEQKAYLANYLQSVEDVVWGQGPWAEVMDGESAARYWWVQEFTQNQDAYLTPSTYLYKKRGGKLYWGPLWDFDQSMGLPSGGTEGFGSRQMDWLDFLRAYDSDYQEFLYKNWASYDAILDDVLRMGGILDRLANEMQLSWQKDFDLWVKDSPTGPYAKTFNEEVESLRSWISDRRDWINNHIDKELTEVFGKVTFVVDDETIGVEYVRLGQYLYTLPDPPHKDGQVFRDWQSNEGEFAENPVCVDEDMELHAIYSSVDDAVMGQDLYLGTYDIWVHVGDTLAVRYTVVPTDAQEQYPQWSSSDVAVAEVSAYGVVKARQVGTATITGMLTNEASKSLVVHVVEESEELSTNVEAMYLEADTLTLKRGAYGQMGLTILPQANDMVLPSYVVDDEGVATVDDNGVVYGVAPGTTVVRLCDAGDPDKVYASYTVIVEGTEEDPEPEPDPDSEESESDPDPDPGSDPDPEQGSDPDPEPGTDPQPTNAPESASDPAAVESSKSAIQVDSKGTDATGGAQAGPLQRPSSANPRTGDTSFTGIPLLVAAGVAVLLVRRKLLHG